MSDLRLAMGTSSPGRDRLDGGWWPRSRDLATELGALVDDFPAQYGRIVRAVYSPADWDDAPRRIAVRGRSVKVGKLPRDDSHVINLTTSDQVVYCVLVVPSSFDEAQGSEALLAAATRGNRHSAADLLDTVTDQLAVDQAHLWEAEGVS